MNNLITLRIQGKAWSGWKSVKITRSLDQLTSSFSLDAASYGPLGKDFFNIRCGALCSIYHGDILMLNGRVDSLNASHDGDGGSISVSGRSATCHLVDCSAIVPDGAWRDISSEELIVDIANRYGIKVYTVSEEAKIRMKIFRVDAGETCYEVIDRLSKTFGFRVYDTFSGDLLISDIPEVMGDALLLSQNMLSSSLSVDISNRFDRIICRGQQAGGEKVSGVEASNAYAQADDENFTPGVERVLILNSNGFYSAEACGYRAWAEVTQRLGQSISVNVDVNGWMMANGNPWNVGLSHDVADDFLGICERLLCVTTDFSLDENGFRTTLTLSPGIGYAALREEFKRKKGKRVVTLAGLGTDTERVKKAARYMMNSPLSVDGKARPR